MNYDKYLEPPDDIECCEAPECTEPNDEGLMLGCVCEYHYCDTCEMQCNCRCDADYERWKDSRD